MEEVPIAQGPRDLAWVAARFQEHGRRPVFEDFHHLSLPEQRRMSFIIKALGEWRVQCVVIGIWPVKHLLTFYNGELDGRIEDLHLRWTGAELDAVLRKGADALNVHIDDALREQMVRDAHTSVGLLQEMARELMIEAGVLRGRFRIREVADPSAYERARARVVERMGGRFDPFLERFALGPVGGEGRLHRALLRLVVESFSEEDLLEGIPLAEVRIELSYEVGDISHPDVEALMMSLEEVQLFREVAPAVLAYDIASQRLVLADRRFLLYRRLHKNRPPL